MNILRSIKWINRHSAAPAILALLLFAGLTVHLLAVENIPALKGLSAARDARLLRNIAGIEFINSNWWFVLPYLTLAFGILFYLEVRAAPRWAVWISFLFLALPALGYLCTCMRVGSCFVTVIGHLPGP